MAIETIRGKRADLSALPVNAPTEYIGGLVYPVLTSTQKSGTAYFSTLTADSAAQTNRSAGSAPTQTVIAPSSDTFTATECIKRYFVSRDEVVQMGGVEISDKLGGTAAKRSVLRAIETAQAAALFSTARYNAAADIHSSIIDGIGAAAESIKRYGGRTAFVCSTTVYRWLVAQTEIKDKMGFSFAGGNLNDVLSLNQNIFKAMLQGIFAFDAVLVADDNHWKIEHKEDAAAIVKLPDPAEFSHKLDPVLGKTVVYTGENGIYDLESFYSDDLKGNVYDATSYYNVLEMNAGAAVLVKKLGTATT